MPAITGATLVLRTVHHRCGDTETLLRAAPQTWAQPLHGLSWKKRWPRSCWITELSLVKGSLSLTHQKGHFHVARWQLKLSMHQQESDNKKNIIKETGDQYLWSHMCFQLSQIQVRNNPWVRAGFLHSNRCTSPRKKTTLLHFPCSISTCSHLFSK